MNNKGFKKILVKSVLKNTIIGSGIFLFGVFICWIAFSGADPEMTTGIMIGCSILATICVLIGFGISFLQLKDYLHVKRGNHPIVNAIAKNEQDYCLWIYEHITQIRNGGSDHQIWIFNKTGQKFILSLKRKKIATVMTFLSENFPNAVFGYSDETRDVMEEKFQRNKH